ncbi:MAG: DUF123 domain-containing protein [Promethearchaeota archaeon]
MKGSYILVIFLNFDTHIKIGKLANVFFKKGYYYYVGSAMGNSSSSSLENRIKRHLRFPEQKKNHWHIDYLLENNEAKIIKIWLIPNKKKLECVLAKELIEVSGVYIKNFGSSDCNCKSHLIYFENIASNFL